MHLLALETPCSAYVLQDVSKNNHLAQIKFSRKICQIGKTRFRNYFYKNFRFIYKVSQINQSRQFYQNNLNFKNHDLTSCFLTKEQRNPNKVQYLNLYLLYGPNNALFVYTATFEVQIHISIPRGKIVQNIKFSFVSQTSDLISKVDSTRQHESKGMLGFQNRAPDTKLLKFHADREEIAYPKKCDF